MANIPSKDPNIDASAIVPAPEEEEDPEEGPKEDDDDVIEMDDEAEVIDLYMDDSLNDPPPPNSEDEETPPTSPIILDADGQPIPSITSFGQTFHFSESSSTANLLTRNSKIVSIGPMCPNLGTAWKRAVRNVMSYFSGLNKLVKDLSDRFDEDVAIAPAVVATSGIDDDDDDDDTTPMDSQPYEPHLCCLERAQEETHLPH
nr:hypothetical protein [Tanacetum cinerariifolium]